MGAFAKTASFWIVEEEAVNDFQGQYFMDLGSVVSIPPGVASYYGL